jgi:hypothetical protein
MQQNLAPGIGLSRRIAAAVGAASTVRTCLPSRRRSSVHRPDPFRVPAPRRRAREPFRVGAHNPRRAASLPIVSAIDKLVIVAACCEIGGASSTYFGRVTHESHPFPVIDTPSASAPGPLDKIGVRACTRSMGMAISPRGDRPKYRVRSICAGSRPGTRRVVFFCCMLRECSVHAWPNRQGCI